MAFGYHTLQHWDHWLSHHPLGTRLLTEEQQFLSTCLKNQFGKYTLLIGVPHQQNLLSASKLSHHYLLTSLVPKNFKKNYIEGNFDQLPIVTGSQDLVIIPHTLDFIDKPRQLLTEACRIVKPEGLLVIFGFNPYSLWGLKNTLKKNKKSPWMGNFIASYHIKKWLLLAGFELEQQKRLIHRPPLNNIHFYENLRFLETIGNIILPFFGGVYMLLARAKVMPLTPIRLRWKQKLPSIRISTSITGHIAR